MLKKKALSSRYLLSFNMQDIFSWCSFCEMQDKENGGISDRPDDAVDVFHTFFGVAGISLNFIVHVYDLARLLPFLISGII